MMDCSEQIRQVAHLGNYAAAVDTKSRIDPTIDDYAGFIRVRRRALKGRHSSAASFDIVRSVRVNGKPRHRFVLGLGSFKSPMSDWHLLLHWACILRRMSWRKITKERMRELIREMINKGAPLPRAVEYNKYLASNDMEGFHGRNRTTLRALAEFIGGA